MTRREAEAAVLVFAMVDQCPPPDDEVMEQLDESLFAEFQRVAAAVLTLWRIRLPCGVEDTWQALVGRFGMERWKAARLIDAVVDAAPDGDRSLEALDVLRRTPR